MGYDWEQRLRITVDAIKSKRFKNFERDMKSGTLWADKSVKAGLISQKRDNDALVASIEGRYKKEQNLIKKTDKQQFQSGENRARIMDYEFKKQKDLIKKTDKQQFQYGENRARIMDYEFKKQKDLIKRTDKQHKQQRQLVRNLELKGVSPSRVMGMDIKQLDALNHKLNVVGKSARKFKMHWLGIMFAGMAVDRAMTRLIRGMLKNYKELTKEAMTPLSKSLIGLEANWKFLTFSIMEASGPMLTTLVDGFTKMLQWIGKANPATLKTIAISILAIAAAGKIFMVGGQFALAWTSFSAMIADFKLSKLTRIKKGVKDIGTASSKISAGKWALGGVLALTATISTFQMFTDDETSPLMRGINIASMAAMGAWIGSIIAPGVGTAIGAIIGATVGIVLNIVDIKIEKKNQVEFNKARNELQDYINSNLEKGIDVSAVEFGARFQNVIVNSIDSDKLRKELSRITEESFFQFKEGGINEETFKRQLAESLRAVYKAPEIKEAGDNLADKMITPSITATEKLIDKIATDGGEAFTVELTESVGTFLNDEESGMAALQKSAKNFSEEMSKPVTKTVTIRTFEETIGPYGGRSEANFTT